MKLRRVYLVEFMLPRKRRPGRRLRRNWRGGQLDLPGLPDYSTPPKPQLEAHLVDHADEYVPAARRSVPVGFWMIFAALLGVPMSLEGGNPKVWLWIALFGFAWLAWDWFRGKVR